MTRTRQTKGSTSSKSSSFGAVFTPSAAKMQETRNKIPAASAYIVEMRTIQSDIFNRESIAKTMCKYIVETPSDIISPIILDGQWGSGKTTHAIRMRECIRREYKDSVKCIY